MKFALVISSLVAAAFAQTINTPESVLSCANHQVTFSGGTAPYTILVVPGGDSSAAAIETYQNVACSPFTWFVTEAAGVSVFLRLQDSGGASVSTAPFTIQAGGSTNCTAPTGGAPQGSCSAGTTVTGAAPGGGATTSAPATGGSTSAPAAGGSSTGAPSGTGSGSASHSTASSTSSTGAAFSNQVSIAGAVVGIVAMGLAALA